MKEATTTIKPVTKKEFEELVNKEHGFDDFEHGANNHNRKAKKREYGTYIRAADKEMFDISYKRYLRTGKIYISLWDED